MSKTFFKLPSYYEGLTARRIRQSGRLWLVRVVSEEGPNGERIPVRWPYWFVIIKGFDPERDEASGAKSIGVWRFGYEDQAITKFEELRPLYPPHPTRPPTPAQIAVRNRVRAHGIPKIHKEIPGTPISGVQEAGG
jgi:hypothetical protein